jgi:hypothetical protein
VIQVICSLAWRWSGTTAPFFAIHFTKVALLPLRYWRCSSAETCSTGWASSW